MTAMYTMQTPITHGHVSHSVHNHHHADTQMTPNWQHHSNKQPKRRLKPQALRARKAALKSLKRRLNVTAR